MLHLFRRLFDAIEYRKQEAENRRKRELPPDVDPDLVAVIVPPPSRARPQLTCRVCGNEGRASYCPHCLAETMV